MLYRYNFACILAHTMICCTGISRYRHTTRCTNVTPYTLYIEYVLMHTRVGTFPGKDSHL